MLGSHLHVFIWQGILLIFFIIFPLMVKLLLTTCKGTCEGGAHWNRRAGAGCGSWLEGWRKAHLKWGGWCVALPACYQGLCSLCFQVFCRVLLPVLGAGGCCCWGPACAASGCCTPECCWHWSGAFPWGESLDHATSASLHTLPMLRWRVGPCWRLHAKILLRALEWGRECCQKCPFLPLTPSSEAAFTLRAVVSLEAAPKAALSLSVPSGQPASLLLPFSDFWHSIGTSSSHGHARGLRPVGGILGKSFQY